MVRNIGAVVVIYNPDHSLLTPLLKNLVLNCLKVLVIDNSEELVEVNVEGVQVISMDGNKGIAAAQNKGIVECLLSDVEKVIFFDQDSIVKTDFINNISAQFDDPSVQIAAPVFFDKDKGFSYKLVDIKKYGFRRAFYPDKMLSPVDISVVISSGTMVKSEVFSVVGLMDEKLFIDYVDTEWCLRCAKHGISIRVDPSIVMIHSIGDYSIKLFSFNIPIHSPVRRYYRIRNSLYLLRLSHVPKIVAIREVIFSIVHQIIIIAISRDRKNYVSALFRAVFDGLANKTGKLKVESFDRKN